MDEYGYLTKEELERLKVYCGHLDNEHAKMDIDNLLEFLHEIWWQPDWGIRRDGRNLELHTGGWSGNEEIISILANSLFWIMCWEMTKRGGHYYFELPKGYDNL